MEDKDRDKLYETLINVLKLFKNMPYHLAKYLIDNNALNDFYIRKLLNSKFSGSKDVQFKDINHLNEYFNSILDDDIKKEKTSQEIAIELNQKLEILVKEEKYEEAIFIRDYMNRNNIPRIIL
jgi:hypothetical protein